MHLLQWKLERKRKKNNRFHPKFFIKVLATVLENWKGKERKRFHPEFFVKILAVHHSKMHLLQWKLERKRKRSNRFHPKFLIKILMATLKCTYFSENRKRKERKTLQNRILFYNLSINFISLSVLLITDKVGQWLHFGFMWFSALFHGSLVAQFDNATKAHKNGWSTCLSYRSFPRGVCTHTSTIAAITAQYFFSLSHNWIDHSWSCNHRLFVCLRVKDVC